MKKRKRDLNNLIIISFIIVLVFSYFLMKKNPNVLFVGNIVLCIMLCIKCKASIFTLKALLVNYVLIAVAFQYNTGSSYGLLQISHYKLNYDIINFLDLIYMFIIYLFVSKSKFLKHEKEKQLQKYNTSFISAFICGIMAISFSIIAFPALLINDTRGRFEGLLPGRGWNHIVVISLLLAYPKLKDSLFVKISYLFCIAWFLLSGERVDMIGLIFGILFLTITKKISSIDKNQIFKFLKYGILAITIVFIMVYIGENRFGNTAKLSDIPKKVLIQNTAADIGYVYNISINYKKNFGLLYGKTYGNYLNDAIPFYKSYSAANLLNDTYGSPGGIFILSEPYMNFGIIGIVLFTLLEIYVIYWITKRKTKYSYFLYLFILVTQFRICWYGISYIETGIIYILPILFILIENVNKKVFVNK